jgi:hypothetical protein
VREAGREKRTLSPGQDLALDPKAFALLQGGGKSEAGYPIIPLTKRMMQPIDIPADDKPNPSQDILESLRPAIRKRIDKAACESAPSLDPTPYRPIIVCAECLSNQAPGSLLEADWGSNATPIDRLLECAPEGGH